MLQAGPATAPIQHLLFTQALGFNKLSQLCDGYYEVLFFPEIL